MSREPGSAPPPWLGAGPADASGAAGGDAGRASTGHRVIAGVVVVVALALAGGVAAADLTGALSGVTVGGDSPRGSLLADTHPAAAAVGEATRAGAGATTCPVVSGGEEPARLAVATAGDAPSQVRIQRFEEGRPRVGPPQALEPGTPREVELGAAQAARPVGVRWRGEPVAVSRIVGGSPAAAGPCEAYPHPVWHVVGFDTTLESQATLHLVNPYATDAVVRVTFGTPQGHSALVRTSNVLVGAGRHRALDLTELQPQHPELSATVEVLTGRVVAQGEMVWGTTDQQQGPEGRAMLAAVPGRVTAQEATDGDDAAAGGAGGAAEPGASGDEGSGDGGSGGQGAPGDEAGAEPTAGMSSGAAAVPAGTDAAAPAGAASPSASDDAAAGDGGAGGSAGGDDPGSEVLVATGVRAGEEYTSWLVVHNPGSRTASFELSVTDPREGAPALMTDTGVPAGGVVRVNLAEVSKAPRFAVAIDPAGKARLAATRVTAITTPDGRQDISAAPLQPPATGWAVAGARADGGTLTVANFGPQPARVDVDAGPATPDSWAGRAVAAGATAAFPLGELEGEGPVPVRVDADSPVAVGLTRLEGGSDLSLWSLGATDTATWQATADPAARRDPTLPGRLAPDRVDQATPAP